MHHKYVFRLPKTITLNLMGKECEVPTALVIEVFNSVGDITAYDDTGEYFCVVDVEVLHVNDKKLKKLISISKMFHTRLDFSSTVMDDKGHTHYIGRGFIASSGIYVGMEWVHHTRRPGKSVMSHVREGKEYPRDFKIYDAKTQKHYEYHAPIVTKAPQRVQNKWVRTILRPFQPQRAS